MRAAGYVRVSTEDQADHGLNLEEDRQRVRELCEEKGWERELFDDGAAQGDDPDRPELLRMIDSLDRFDVVVLRDLDRLSRKPMIHELACDAFRRAGVKLVSYLTGPIDIETPQGDFTSGLFALIGKYEKRQTGERVKLAMQARIRAGIPSGGTPRYGFVWDKGTRTEDHGATALVEVPTEVAVVRRVHSDYASGLSQRAIQRALNAECVPAPGGGVWQQSAIARILSDPIYVGKLTVRGDDGKSVVVEGAHEAIVDDELWNRVQAIREGGSRRKSGRPAAGGHLCVRGVLRCGTCGSAMIPDRGRGRRDRYICRGRVEHGPDFCSRPSIVREAIDEKLLAALLDGYIDLDATRQRIEARIASALADSQESLEQAERETAKAEAKLARVRSHYQEGRIEPEDWAEQRSALAGELEAAHEAVKRAQDHVGRLEHEAMPDAEQALLAHLAALKQAVAAGVDQAPDLSALRNVIGQMLSSVDLVPNDDGSYLLLLMPRVLRMDDDRWDLEAAGRRQELPLPAQIDPPTKVTG
jgi:site-specific DNA recombinase